MVRIDASYSNWEIEWTDMVWLVMLTAYSTVFIPIFILIRRSEKEQEKSLGGSFYADVRQEV
jgi:hypothetical protein